MFLIEMDKWNNARFIGEIDMEWNEGYDIN